MEWIDVNKMPIPKHGKEVLTKNMMQGGVLNLIKYNGLRFHYENKGKFISDRNAGTHWLEIPDLNPQ